jgi:UDP-N-acetylglucosamine--N-acetylmuramyl-(pentapeptide) pyrophosphoryl-undecaprenol N-acetylglucosamine transferase
VRVLLAGGGTAGHLFPCLAVAEELAERVPGVEAMFVGARGRVDEKLLAERDLPHHLISARPMPYRLSPEALAGFVALLRGRSETRRVMRSFHPDVVFSTGGYVGAAVVLAAGTARVPVVLHVADAVPDRSNRLLARWANAITTAWPEAGRRLRRKVVVTGQPIRREVAAATREDGVAAFGLWPERPVLLITGGSQGARTLNSAVLEALPALLGEMAVQVVHLCGDLDYERVRAAAAGRGGEAADYHLLAHVPNPGPALAAADLVVTRGGANALAEACLHAVPMVVVPYPYAGGHQRANAEPLAQAGAAVVVEDAEVHGDRLLEVTRSVLDAPARAQEMSQASRAMAHPRAAAEVAAVVAEVAG